MILITIITSALFSCESNQKTSEKTNSNKNIINETIHFYKDTLFLDYCYGMNPEEYEKTEKKLIELNKLKRIQNQTVFEMNIENSTFHFKLDPYYKSGELIALVLDFRYFNESDVQINVDIEKAIEKQFGVISCSFMGESNKTILNFYEKKYGKALKSSSFEGFEFDIYSLKDEKRNKYIEIIERYEPKNKCKRNLTEFKIKYQVLEKYILEQNKINNQIKQKEIKEKVKLEQNMQNTLREI